MTETAKILIVEDDPQMRRFLQVLLKGHAYQVDCAGSAREALARMVEKNADIILLDLGLPDLDGLELVRRIRETSATPIIVISARELEDDKVKALDNGADDYLTKPFGSSELLARIRVALRHADQQDQPKPVVFESANLTIDFNKRLVWRAGELVHLTPTEYRLLHLLVSNNGRVMTYRQILKDIWGGNQVEHNHYVRVHMAQLRHKVELNPAQPKYLLTENGVGYRFRFEHVD